MKERLKMAREHSGLNKTKFAEKLGLTVSTVSLYESGNRVPADSTLKLISKEFSISYDWLKTGEGPMEIPQADDGSLSRVIESYQNLPENLQMMIDALAEMDPEWWKTLDIAFEEIKRRRKGAD